MSALDRVPAFLWRLVRELAVPDMILPSLSFLLPLFRGSVLSFPAWHCLF